MSNRVQHITIVGGGTAGWMAAALLWEFINAHSDQSGVEVTLIESPRIPTVGVGEATVPAMPRLLQQMGIDEGEFFRRCNASFKCAVRFADWNRAPDGSPISVYNPFNIGRHPGASIRATISAASDFQREPPTWVTPCCRQRRQSMRTAGRAPSTTSRTHRRSATPTIWMPAYSRSTCATSASNAARATCATMSWNSSRTNAALSMRCSLSAAAACRWSSCSIAAAFAV